MRVETKARLCPGSCSRKKVWTSSSSISSPSAQISYSSFLSAPFFNLQVKSSTLKLQGDSLMRQGCPGARPAILNDPQCANHIRRRAPNEPSRSKDAAKSGYGPPDQAPLSRQPESALEHGRRSASCLAGAQRHSGCLGCFGDDS